jgi:SAM-dependent methyltransferase
MKKEPKTIIDSNKDVLDRKGEEGSALKESQRVMSTSESIFLRKLKEKGFEPREDNHLDIWFVQNRRDKNSGLQLEDIQKIYAFEREHNNKAKESEEDIREYRFKEYDSGDLSCYLEQVYGNPQLIRDIPEVVIIHGKSNETDGAWTGTSDSIKKAVEKCLDRLNVTTKEIDQDLDDFIIYKLGEEVCSNVAYKFDYYKNELNEENIIEYGLYNLESTQREIQKRSYAKYILSGDMKFLEEFFSEEVLKEIYENTCKFDEDNADELTEDFWGEIEAEGQDPENKDAFFVTFRASINHAEKRAAWEAGKDERRKTDKYFDEEDDYDWEGEEVYAAKENYENYRKSLAEFAASLSFENIKDKMKQSYIEKVKKVLDEYAERYIADLDWFESEKRLLSPILVFISDNPIRQELMRKYGADIVLNKFDQSQMQELLEMTAKIKNSSASIAPDKLRRMKTKFYKSVQDNLEKRSEVTAETEKELSILEDIFERVGNVDKVLDIACGYGRIDIPLLEKGYAVTGVDASEQFLQDALRKSFEKNLTRATFKKGDVIDYTGAVDNNSQDAVIYTWHSILEAFGVGNTLHTLNDAWMALRPGGVLVFDQPTRENPNMEDGWYGHNPDAEHKYLSYIMTEDEIAFILKMAGFENVEILKWKTKSSEDYPDGMNKFTISARKPETSEAMKEKAKMYDWYFKEGLKEWQDDTAEWDRKRTERLQKEKEEKEKSAE